MKEKKKSTTIKINPETKEKLKLYSERTNLKMVNIIDNLINNLLKDTIFNNIGIELEKPVYFNQQDLFLYSEVEATTEEPFNNFDNWKKLNKIPNNLDSWNKEYKTFCYNDNKTQHRGINQVLTLKYDLKNNKLIPIIIYCLFVLDYKAFILEELKPIELKLRIGIVNEEELKRVLNKDIPEQNKLLLEFEENKKYWNDYINNSNYKVNEVLNFENPVNEVLKNIVDAEEIPFKENVQIFHYVNLERLAPF